MVVSEKLSILDLHVSTESNLDINIEIQLINQYNMIKRTVFYMAKMFLNQLKKGENYIKCYGLFEKETKDPLTDILEIIFIELPKFSRFEKKDNIRHLQKINKSRC